MENIHALPETGFLRLRQIIGDRKTDPPTPAIIPVSKSTWWQGIKTGRYPKPVKLGERSQIHQPYIDIDQQHLDFRPRPSDCADFIWKPLDFAGFSESGRLYSFLSILWAQLTL